MSHYMTLTERYKLEALYNNAKMPVAKIAAELGFSRQTIYNELKTGMYMHTCDYWDEERYSADKAQQIHELMQSGKGRPEKIGKRRDYAEFLEKTIIEKRYSPAAALAEARRAGYDITISVNTLYSYIDKGLFLTLNNSHLWEKKKRKEKKEKESPRKAHAKLPSIEDRPEEINARCEVGHWEMDLIIGKKGSGSVLMTLIERMTRREMIFLLPNRKAETVKALFDKLELELPDFKNVIKSITTDNGSEFLKYEKLTESITGGKRFDVYYCHSYAAWEKGSNENSNRIIRRFFPKGTNFDEVKETEIKLIENWINNYPRKILNWNCSNDLYLQAA